MKRLCTLAACLVLTLTAAVGHTYVLCVGVADYPGRRNDLKLSARDAVTMQELYQRNGQSTVRLFTDAEATVNTVMQTFQQLCSLATEDDAVVFFFSGHGMPGAFVCHDGFLSYNDIITHLTNSRAGRKIILADACFAGKARRTDERTAQADGEAYSNKGVLFFLSSRTNEKSIEIRTMQNSLFTAYMERGLRGGADTNLDRTITAREIFDFVSQGVAERSGQRQHPVMWGRFSDDMPLMQWPTQ